MNIPYLSTPDKPISAATQKHLPVADIVDDLAVYKDGGAALVLESTSLNFGLLSEREQQAVIAAYSALLNSLTFSVQIVIRSKRKDISAYMKSLDEAAQRITNPKLTYLMRGYQTFVSDIIKKKNVLEKKFYIVLAFSPLELGVTKSFVATTKKGKTLPFSEDYVIRKAKVALYPKRDHIMRQAGRLGLKLRQLSSNQLVELFYQIYNPSTQKVVEKTKEGPSTATNGELGGLKPSIKSPTLSYTQKEYSVLDIIAPRSIEVDFDYLKINDTYVRTLYAAGYPRFVSGGWLEQIINFNQSLDISFYVYPVEGKSVLDDLRRKIAEMEAEISTDLERGKVVHPGTEAKLEDAKVLQEQLVKGSERFFEFAFYINVPATTLEELNQISKQVESTLGSLLVAGKHASLDMLNGFLSAAPFGVDRLNVTRNMDTTSLATTFPFTSAELSSDRGVLYGINSDNESFIIFDRFSLENGNMTVFATSGAGKSIRGSEPVLYQDGAGNLCRGPIGKVVDKAIQKGRLVRFDEESEGVIKPGIKVYTFDNNLRAGWSKVTVAARKKAPSKLYKIKTKSGREITATKDHNFIVLKQGRIQIVRGETIKRGDYVPLPRSVTLNTPAPAELDVEKVLENSPLKLKRVRKRIGLKRFLAKTSLPTKIKLTPSFFELLGYFASEGSISPKRALITTQEKAVINSVGKYYRQLRLSRSLLRKRGKATGIYVTARVFTEFLKKIKATGKAQQKCVPPVVFSANNKGVSNFLRAYFQGDGGVDGHEISATTKSKDLASDLAYLLLRFGILARVGKTRKAASNTTSKTKRTYYRIRISGQNNIRKFVKYIGFISKKKNEKTKKLLKKGDTNVDVIPEISPVFEEIYKELYASSDTPAPKKFSEIKLGVFKPSPKNLLSIVNKIEKRIEEIENLEKDGLLTLKGLPTTKELINRGLKDNNALLWKHMGKSWWTMKEGTPPKLRNALKVIQLTQSASFTTHDIAGAIYKAFKTTEVSLMAYDKSLWNAIVNENENPLYSKVTDARDYISKKYDEKKKKLGVIKEKLSWLKTLATSDLYWDPIIKIKKVKARHKYVYDLQVDNGVFLAGQAGLFVHNSYFVKLELTRSLMLGTEVIVIDPESEYKSLADAVGGEFISLSFRSPSKINPFDLAQVYEEGENQLNLKLLSLHSLFKVIMGTLNARQEALLDQALVNTYRAKGISQDPLTQKREPPLMEDLYKSLIGLETPEALDLAARIEKFVKGSFVGILDHHTNVDIKNPFTVFSVKDLEEALRPIAMFVILDYIWTRVKRELKRRILVVDEAWHMMRYPDTAQFLWSVVKRSRKYYLGLTTITQDVEDFLAQDIGKAVVTNSALQLLLKQSPAAIDKVGELFYLSEGEKQLLLGANIGEGIFFAGAHHAPISIVASREEHGLITTKPQELVARPMSIATPREPGAPIRPSTPGEAARLAAATNPALRRQVFGAKAKP